MYIVLCAISLSLSLSHSLSLSTNLWEDVSVDDTENVEVFVPFPVVATVVDETVDDSEELLEAEDAADEDAVADGVVVVSSYHHIHVKSISE